VAVHGVGFPETDSCFDNAHGRRLVNLSVVSGFSVFGSSIACIFQRDDESARTNTALTLAFWYRSDRDDIPFLLSGLSASGCPQFVIRVAASSGGSGMIG
jgi:hypothetical protein